MQTILVAEPSPRIRAQLALDLQEAGYQLMVAADGIEAVRLCAERSPDLLLLDCGLAGLSGLKICQLIRTQFEADSLPILLTSDQIRDLNRAEQVGATATAQKPLVMRSLLHQVNGLLAPAPKTSQAVRVEVGGGFTPVRVKQTLLGGSIVLPPLPHFRLRPRQQITLTYHVLGGMRATRRATIESVEEEGVTLRLEPGIELDQRRRHFRKATEMFVRYRMPGDFYRLARTLDVSGGGARLGAVGAPVDVGARIAMELVLNPMVKVGATGVVRRILSKGGEPELGVEFEGLDPLDQQTLVFYLFTGLAGFPGMSLA